MWTLALSSVLLLLTPPAFGQLAWDDETICGSTSVPTAGQPRASTGLSNQKIIGGWDAIKGEWPWQVSMRNGPDGADHYCGGSMLNNMTVITAAHCCAGELAANMWFGIGDHDFSENNTQNPDRVVKLADTIMTHEDFGPITLINDICLVTLRTPIEYTDFVGTACPPVLGATYDYVNTSVSGWGSLNDDGLPAKYPDILQTINMNTTNNTRCYAEIREYDPAWVVTADMICAGNDPYDAEDSCSGDSGGPMVYKNARGLWELIGLTSWGVPPCAGGYPGVYCRVEHFLDWIDLSLGYKP